VREMETETEMEMEMWGSGCRTLDKAMAEEVDTIELGEVIVSADRLDTGPCRFELEDCTL